VSLFLSFQASAAEPVKIVMLGDSLTAGYGLVKGQAVPAQLERALKAEGVNVKIINAGVSGDTSAGGRARLTWALSEQPEGLIIELGANDGLRGLDPKQTLKNLNALIEQALSAQIDVLLTGMLAPPNLGPEYGKDFNRVYPLLARYHGIELYPFYLEGVVSDPALNLEDGLHPNEKGVAIIVKNLLPKVKNFIAKLKK
jgi:acyl-CoA thioesterase-1